MSITAPQSWVRRKLGLPAEFSGNVEFGVDVLNAEADMRNYRFEANFGWWQRYNQARVFGIALPQRRIHSHDVWTIEQDVLDHFFGANLHAALQSLQPKLR